MGWKNLLFYVVVLLIFGTGIYVLLQFGSHLQAGTSASQKRVESPSSTTLPSYPPQSDASSSVLGKVLHENLRHPLSILLLQVMVIILTTRVIGTLFLKMKQPAVMGKWLLVFSSAPLS
jgi:K+:H+ antiporter